MTDNKFQTFRDLHDSGELFVMPNPWDTGSACMLAALGFKALATTSAGYAFSKGKQDYVGAVMREESLAHAKDIVDATALPVNADFENGFGDTPEEVAKTVTAAAGIGLAGCSIEDTTGIEGQPIYDFSLTVERMEAAVEAARAVERPFVLTARAENYLHGRPDIEDTLKRLAAFDKAGADVLYAPGLPDVDAIRIVCQSTSKPVNIVAGIGLEGVSVAELRNAGVRRISLGSALARAAYGKMLSAAREILQDGDMSAYSEAASFGEIAGLISKGTRT